MMPWSSLKKLDLSGFNLFKRKIDNIPVPNGNAIYFGRPVSYQGEIYILLADFPRSSLHVFRYDNSTDHIIQIVSLPLAAVEDCHNLLLRRAPLMLTRQANNGKFQIVWPEKIEFDIGETESFYDQQGDKLFFCRWHDEPEYQEEIVIRKYPSGEVLEVIPGAWKDMPDGQIWVLQ